MSIKDTTENDSNDGELGSVLVTKGDFLREKTALVHDNPDASYERKLEKHINDHPDFEAENDTVFTIEPPHELFLLVDLDNEQGVERLRRNGDVIQNVPVIRERLTKKSVTCEVCNEMKQSTYRLAERPNNGVAVCFDCLTDQSHVAGVVDDIEKVAEGMGETGIPSLKLLDLID